MSQINVDGHHMEVYDSNGHRLMEKNLLRTVGDTRGSYLSSLDSSFAVQSGVVDDMVVNIDLSEQPRSFIRGEVSLDEAVNMGFVSEEEAFSNHSPAYICLVRSRYNNK